METHEVVHAALEWAKSNGYAQRAREDAGGLTIDELAKAQGVGPANMDSITGTWPGDFDDGFEDDVDEARHGGLRQELEQAQKKIEHLRKVVDEWRKTCDAIDRCSKEVQQRECGLRKELEAANWRIEELRKGSDGLRQQRDESERDLEQAHRKIKDLEATVDEWAILHNHQNQSTLKAQKELETAQARIEELENDLRKQQDAYNMQRGDVEQKQRRIEELEKEWEQAKEVHLFNTVLRKDLDAAKDRIDELTKERDGVLRHNDELANERNAASDNYQTILSENEQLRANHQGELAQYIRQNEQLREDLDAAKDARIIAEKEANDLRAWRSGLVKPGTVRPKLFPVVALVDSTDRTMLIHGGNIYDHTVDFWFDPRDIFEAADRDAEQADMDVRR